MTLYVDYGNKRVTLKHSVWVGRKDHTVFNKVKWCEGTFKPDTFRYFFDDGKMYFKRKKDLMWFQLRWANHV